MSEITDRDRSESQQNIRQYRIYFQAGNENEQSRHAQQCRSSVNQITAKILPDDVAFGPEYNQLITDIGIGDRQNIGRDGQ